MPAEIAAKMPDTSTGAVVVTLAAAAPGSRRSHEEITRRELAKRLARLRGYRFAGEFDPGFEYPGRVYFVPADTVVGSLAARLGIRSDDDLFGAVVPHPFVATKAITHPLLAPDARAPAGWSHALGERLRDVVLDGFSAFDTADARRAGLRLLEAGPVRVKRVLGIGGSGQFVVQSAEELDEVLSTIADDEMAESGVVIEQDLADVTTFSVGQVRLNGLVASYFGTQSQTRNNSGTEVYGGSELVVTRGDFDALLRLPIASDTRLAVDLGRRYEEAALAYFPGFFASRRNYDVALGIDARGRVRAGVLEQSWRMGGASGAEVAALEAFHADPKCTVARARCVEAYGEHHVAPPGATVYFRGVDERVGPLTKYTVLEEHADAR